MQALEMLCQKRKGDRLLISCFLFCKNRKDNKKHFPCPLDLPEKMSPLGHIVERCGESYRYYYMYNKPKNLFGLWLPHNPRSGSTID